MTLFFILARLGPNDPTLAYILSFMLFMSGCFLIYVGIKDYIEARKSSFWPSVQGQIIEANDEYIRKDLSLLGNYYLTLRYSYEVLEKQYIGTRLQVVNPKWHHEETFGPIRDQYRDNTEVHVFYDPASPEQSVIIPGKQEYAARVVCKGVIFIILAGVNLLVAIKM